MNIHKFFNILFLSFFLSAGNALSTYHYDTGAGNAVLQIMTDQLLYKNGANLADDILNSSHGFAPLIGHLESNPDLVKNHLLNLTLLLGAYAQAGSIESKKLFLPVQTSTEKLFRSSVTGERLECSEEEFFNRFLHEYSKLLNWSNNPRIERVLKLVLSVTYSHDLVPKMLKGAENELRMTTRDERSAEYVISNPIMLLMLARLNFYPIEFNAQLANLVILMKAYEEAKRKNNESWSPIANLILNRLRQPLSKWEQHPIQKEYNAQLKEQSEKREREKIAQKEVDPLGEPMGCAIQ